MKTTIVLSLLFIATIGEGYRILGVFPHPGKSHHYVFLPLLIGLAEKGHNVTVISQFPTEKAPPTLKDIDISLKGDLWGGVKFDMNFFDMHRYILNSITPMNLFHIAYNMCENLLKNEEVLSIKPGDYDVMITERFNSDCPLGLAHRLQIPYIGFTSHTPFSWTLRRMGALQNPSYIPNHYTHFGKFPNPFEIIEAALVTMWFDFTYYLYTNTAERWLMTKYLGDDIPSLEEIGRNMSLVLVNTYFPLTGTTPFAPNYVEIGGLHLKKKGYIDDDTLEFLDKSTNGVILFSMGSMLKSSSWSPELLKIFQDVLSKRPENVLWKWENETMENQPANIRIEKWIPQFDILHHPNVKAFIYHGGMLGITEAAYCGVPIIGIPIFGDQFFNTACARDSGLGVVLRYRDISEENLKNALETVLEPSFQKQAKAFAEVFRDRPQTPLETGIYWVEHVARHGGGKHLRPLSAELPLYRYLLLDVMLVVIIITLPVLYIMWKCCCRRKSRKPKIE